MAKKDKGAKGTVKLTESDFKGKKFPTASGGKYIAVFSKKSEIVPMKKDKKTNQIRAILTLLKDSKGKKVKGKINVFDYLSAKGAWKIAQVLTALGKKKMKEITLQDLLKLIVGKQIRVVVTETEYKKKPKNEISQYLPLKGGDDEEDEESDDEDSEDEEEDSDDEDSDEDEDEDDDEDSDDDSDEEDDEDSDDEDDEEDEDDESDDEDEDEDSDDEDEDDDSDDEEEDDDEEDEDEDEDEDDDEDEKPKKGKGKKDKKKPAKKAAKKGGKKKRK